MNYISIMKVFIGLVDQSRGIIQDDMIGNVWEWTCSAYTISSAGNSKIYYNGNENNCSNPNIS